MMGQHAIISLNGHSKAAHAQLQASKLVALTSCNCNLPPWARLCNGTTVDMHPLTMAQADISDAKNYPHFDAICLHDCIWG